MREARKWERSSYKECRKAGRSNDLIGASVGLAGSSNIACCVGLELDANDREGDVLQADNYAWGILASAN